MKKKYRTIYDPDLGPITLPPDSGPPKDWNRIQARIRAALQRTYFKPGTKYRCSSCNRLELVAANDLTAEFVRGNQVIVFRNLQGARCAKCGETCLEAKEQIQVEEEIDEMMKPVHDAGVSRVGRGTLGTYWPKPVERRLHLAAGDRLSIQVLSPTSALLHVRKPAHPRSRSRVGARRFSDRRRAQKP